MFGAWRGVGAQERGTSTRAQNYRRERGNIVSKRETSTRNAKTSARAQKHRPETRNIDPSTRTSIKSI
ncbi:hypothetical protein [Lentibacillus sp. Marseille-P4043]|uniref:hypothetical protein n=1 Tax=Lentibacillus sp. Marseille-P4043 TaxID=2040293 RepID=UPI00131A4E4A|nr:hypothetical protein [Lentibacillus sp. Marseille-P4043]